MYEGRLSTSSRSTRNWKSELSERAVGKDWTPHIGRLEQVASDSFPRVELQSSGCGRTAAASIHNSLKRMSTGPAGYECGEHHKPSVAGQPMAARPSDLPRISFFDFGNPRAAISTMRGNFQCHFILRLAHHYGIKPNGKEIRDAGHNRKTPPRMAGLFHDRRRSLSPVCVRVAGIE